MYTKKCSSQPTKIGALGLGVSLCFGVSSALASPAPDPYPTSNNPPMIQNRNLYTSSSTGTGYTSSTGVSYDSYRAPARAAYAPDPSPIYDTVYVPAAPRSSYQPNISRSGDPEEAAMLTACNLERRPYGTSFDGSRVASNWKWSEVRRDIHRELEFSSRRHGQGGFENPMCELFVLRKMYEQGGASAVSYRCEMRKGDYYRALGNIQAGRGNGTAAFQMLDKVMKSSSSTNSQAICRRPSGEDVYACATQDFTANALDGALQREMSSGIMEICGSFGSNMNPMYTQNSYMNAGIMSNGGGVCSPMVAGHGGGGGVTVLMQNEPWYKTVLSAGLGALKVLGPLYVLNKAHERREETSQLAIKTNAGLGFASAVTGSGSGCFGYGTCANGYGNNGIMIGGGFGGGFGGGVGGGMCGMPPYAPWAGGCGAGAGGGYYMPGMQGGVNGNWGLGGQGGVAGYPGLWGYGNGMPGVGAMPGAGGMPASGFGPWGTMGNAATNGWGPANNNQWGANGQFGQPAFWGTGAQNGVYGANAGYFQDSFQAQQARAINRNNRFSTLYDNYAQDTGALADSMRGTAQSYYSGGGSNYYSAYGSNSGYTSSMQYYAPYQTFSQPYAFPQQNAPQQIIK